MEYAELARFFNRLEETPKRLEMTAILVELLQGLDPDEFAPVAYLLQGKVAPDWEGIELGLAEKMVLRTLEAATGNKKMETLYHQEGDLGRAAEVALGATGQRQQALFQPEPLTIASVFQQLRNMAGVADRTSQVKAAGAEAQKDKARLLSKLLNDASPLEARYIIRTVAGRARLGVADMTFLDALAYWHSGEAVRSVQEMDEEVRASVEDVRKRLERAYDVTSELARVAQVLARDGMDAIDRLDVTLGVPLRPMAAERLKTLAEILAKHDGRSALEYKYDGLRVQCHVPADPDEPVRIFSRRMEELTPQFPDVARMLRDAFQPGAAGTTDGGCIVEGECVAVDPESGAMRPFQELSRRRGRKTGLGEDARQEAALSEGATAGETMMDRIPVAVYLFDCLAADGTSVMHEPYAERRARVADLFALDGRVQASAMEVAEDEAAMEAFFARAVADGAEGMMCKALGAPYKAGNRGFDWIKYKTDYTEDLVDSMDLVVVGAFHGRGRRAGWYGALLMAAYDPQEDRYVSVCKLGTGFDDETLTGLRERFAAHEAQERPPNVESGMEPDVWFHPAIVMEVQAAELTLSPTHRAAWGRLKDGAGLAARFPRFSGRWRDDKGPEHATTADELVQMYEEQGAS